MRQNQALDPQAALHRQWSPDEIDTFSTRSNTSPSTMMPKDFNNITSWMVDGNAVDIAANILLVNTRS